MVRYLEFLCEFDTHFDKGEKAIEVERSHPHKNIVLMKIKVLIRLEARLVRGKILYEQDDVELEKGSYFVQDLINILSMLTMEQFTVSCQR